MLSFQENLSSRISELEQERYALRLKLRRVKTPEEDTALKEQCKEITKKITPLRKEYKIAIRIEEHIPKIKALLDAERNIEMKRNNLNKNKERGYEKNVLGTLRDDLFERMTANYEQEQRELIQSVADLEQRLANAEQDNIALRALLSIIRKCTDLKELTPELVNRLITKIEVFDSTKDENVKKHVPIKVHFIGVGVLEIPDGKTILETYEEIRKNPPKVALKRNTA